MPVVVIRIEVISRVVAVGLCNVLGTAFCSRASLPEVFTFVVNIRLHCLGFFYREGISSIFVVRRRVF